MLAVRLYNNIRVLVSYIFSVSREYPLNISDGLRLYHYDLGTVDTDGSAFIGSSIAHQLPEPKSDGTIIRINDGSEFPALPLATHDMICQYQVVLNSNEHLFMDGLCVSQSLAEEIEELTRKQSDCLEWHELRQKRLNSATFKDIVTRKKDFGTLTYRLTSTRKIQTQAMKHGIENEGNAVLEYSTHKNVNVKLCGFLINPAAPFLGSSPDRLVYDPNDVYPFGVLEVKCPPKESYKDSQFLKGNGDGTYSLKNTIHTIYK